MTTKQTHIRAFFYICFCKKYVCHRSIIRSIHNEALKGPLHIIEHIFTSISSSIPFQVQPLGQSTLRTSISLEQALSIWTCNNYGTVTCIYYHWHDNYIKNLHHSLQISLGPQGRYVTFYTPHSPPSYAPAPRRTSEPDTEYVTELLLQHIQVLYILMTQETN